MTTYRTTPAERVADDAVTLALYADRMSDHDVERVELGPNFGTEYRIRVGSTVTARVLVGPYAVHVESLLAISVEPGAARAAAWSASFAAAGNVPAAAIADVIIAAATR